MTPLTLFGLIAVTAMLVCYAFEARNPRWILAFAGACAMGSLYGFLQGAWPFGAVEAIWCLVAVRRWRKATREGFMRLAGCVGGRPGDLSTRDGFSTK